MSRSAKITLLLMLSVCAVLALGGLLVYAAPPIPATFYGTVKVNGANVPVGTSVEAYIGGVSYASSAVQVSGADTVYVLDVPGDVPEIGGKQGGTEGETIQFRVGGLTCAQAGVWHKGTQTNLNLTATGTIPTLTPTSTLPPSSTATYTPLASSTPQVTSTPQVVDLKAGNTTVRDTFLDSTNATTNYGSGVRVKVRTISGVQYRPLFYFDLSSIPTGSTIRGATLYLYMDNYSHMPDQSARVSIYKVKQDWAEMEANWNKRNDSASWGTAGCESSADRDASESAYRVVSALSTWYDWNLTSLVQGWVSSPASNRGMILISDASREVRFYTSNDIDARFHPHLRIDYIASGSPGPTLSVTPTSPGVTPVLTPAPVEIRGASQDTYVNKLDPSKNYENKPMVIRGVGEKRALLRFNVTGIPSTAQITSATLRLAATSYNDGKTNLALNVEAYLVNRAWVANQATWLKANDADSWGQAGCNAVPSDREATMAGSTVVQKISGTTVADMVYYDWNVTSIVQEWVRKPSNYAGLLLVAQDGNYREISFYDTAYSVVEYRPLLRVNWVPGTSPTPTPTLAPTLTPTRNLPAGKGTIEGIVFNDLNANGRHDDGETGLAGVQVRLWQGGVLISSKATDSSGVYSFGALNPGWYTISEVDPAGYQSPPSSPNQVYAQVIDGRITWINFSDYDPRYVTPGPAVRLPILRRN